MTNIRKVTIWNKRGMTDDVWVEYKGTSKMRVFHKNEMLPMTVLRFIMEVANCETVYINDYEHVDKYTA